MNINVLLKVIFQKILGGKACFMSLLISFLKKGEGRKKKVVNTFKQIFLLVVGTSLYFLLRLSFLLVCIIIPEGYML